MHVILRGIDRTAIFFAEGDYRVFSDTLAALGEGESVRVHVAQGPLFILDFHPLEHAALPGRTDPFSVDPFSVSRADGGVV